MAKLIEIKRKLSDSELIVEIDAAMKDPEFRDAVKDFVKRSI